MAKLTMGEFREWLEEQYKLAGLDFAGTMTASSVAHEALSKLSEVDEGVVICPCHVTFSIDGMVKYVNHGSERIMLSDYDGGKSGKLIFVEDK